MKHQDMSNFYVIDTVHAADKRLFAGGQVLNDNFGKCAKCGSRRLPEQGSFLVSLDHLGRRGFVEHLWNSDGLPVFREDLFALWKSHGLSGYDRWPVTITSSHMKTGRGSPISAPNYYVLVAAATVILTMPPRREPPCDECGAATYAFPPVGSHLPHGIQIDESSWDGSDFFSVAGYNFLFCSRRAAEVTLMNSPGRHITFIRHENYRRWEDFDVRKGWTAKAYEQHVEGFLIRDIKDL